MGATVSKHIVFPNELLYLAQLRASRLGFNLSEFVRFLVAKAVEKEADEIFLLDEETDKSLGRALEDIKRGRVTTLESDEDIVSHFSKLVE